VEDAALFLELRLDVEFVTRYRCSAYLQGGTEQADRIRRACGDRRRRQYRVARAIGLSKGFEVGAVESQHHTRGGELRVESRRRRHAAIADDRGGRVGRG